MPDLTAMMIGMMVGMAAGIISSSFMMKRIVRWRNGRKADRMLRDIARSQPPLPVKE